MNRLIINGAHMHVYMTNIHLNAVGHVHVEELQKVFFKSFIHDRELGSLQCHSLLKVTAPSTCKYFWL